RRAARAARGRAHPGPLRLADVAAGARAAGLPLRARPDGQRLRGHAQGQLARLGAHGLRADQADADLRHERRELGRARRALRGALPGDVAAAGPARAAARGALEGAHVVSTTSHADTTGGASVLRISGLRLVRGRREILRGVDLAAGAGEIVALMGLSVSGKTTILRIVAGLE